MQGTCQLDRYDRQLRVWGAWGQSLLENAHICLIGSETVLLQETVKHLVLLGISNFTWLNQREESVDPKPRSSELFFKDLLNEMSQLRSDEIHISKTSSYQDIKDYSKFNVIIALNGNDTDNIVLHQSQINLPPVLTARTAGFYGFLKLTLSEPHFVLDPHNEYQKADLRIDQPWPTLQKYIDNINMKGMDIKDAIKYPYPVILAKMLQELMRLGVPTINTNVIKKSLENIYCNEWVYKGSEGVNYREAQRFASRTIVRPDHDQFIKELKEKICPYLITQSEVQKDKWCDPINKKICYLIIELIEFIKETQMGLPLQGDFPDMESDTSEYQKLKTIYNHHRTQYLDLFESKLRKNPMYDSINRQLIEIFCKYILDLTIVKPLEHGEIPESSELYEILTQSINVRCSTQVQKGKFHKIFEPSLFCVDVFLAGLISQETIKLITHQFVPINNTFVYDGYTGTFTEVIRV